MDTTPDAVVVDQLTRMERDKVCVDKVRGLLRGWNKGAGTSVDTASKIVIKYGFEPLVTQLQSGLHERAMHGECVVIGRSAFMALYTIVSRIHKESKSKAEALFTELISYHVVSVITV